ncbi:unnamed protein product [Ceratitis capitata]|nr:unnamed protein product [Ceratitis capitata]
MFSLLIHPENGPVVMEELELNFGRLEFLIKVQMQKIQDFLPIYEGHLEQVLGKSNSVHLDDSRVSITEMTVHVGPDEPIAVTTKLGWVAYGSAPPVSASVQCLLVRKSPTPKQPHQLGKPGSENPK